MYKMVFSILDPLGTAGRGRQEHTMANGSRRIPEARLEESGENEVQKVQGAWQRGFRGSRPRFFARKSGCEKSFAHF